MLGQKKWLTSKFYPVSLDLRVIFDDPSGSKAGCVSYREYAGTGCITVPGAKVASLEAQGYRIVAVEREHSFPRTIKDKAVLALLEENRSLHRQELKQRSAGI